MKPFVLFLVLGLGAGSVYAGLGIGLVLTYRAAGIINFAHGAVAMYTAYVYAELRSTGRLLLPVVGIPDRIDLGSPTGTPLAMVVSLAAAGLLGLAVHAVVFRPLHRAPMLARVVAAIGILIVLQSTIALKYGTSAIAVEQMLPDGSARILGTAVPIDRLWIAGIVCAVAGALSAVFRWTRFGLATRASSESETSVALLGYAPGRLAAGNWVISTVVAGLVGILIAPVTSLNPATYTFFVVPALAAALVGGFRSLWWTVAAGFALGILQSQLTRVSLPWSWLSPQALKQVLPFAVIAGAFLLLGDPLPPRGGPPESRLPLAPRPQRLLVPTLSLMIGVIVLLEVTTGPYRGALILSMIGAILCLSVVVVTGLLGQISLAQMAFAGVAGFTVSRLTSDAGVPFPVAPLAAAVVAGVCGVLLAIPASRARGASLTIVTLGAALAIEELVFRNLSKGILATNVVPPPRFLGLDLRPIGDNGTPRPAFGLLVLAVLTLVALGVVRLRRSATGRRMLAVRANERAAAAVGVNVMNTKLVGFGLSAFVAGVGGALIGYQQGAISDQSFGIGTSLALLAACYVGGISSVSGALVGGLLFSGGIAATVLDQSLNLGRFQTLASGVALVATAILNPQGVSTVMGATLRRFSRGRSSSRVRSRAG